MLNRVHTYASSTEKIKMIQMREAGCSRSEIARELRRDPKTVKLWLDRWDNEQSIEVRQKNGCKRSLTSEEEANLVVRAQQNPSMTAPMIKASFQLDCANRTIQRYLNRNETNSFKSPVKPSIIPINREARISFAEVFKNWTVEDWKRVVFTDESSFYNKRTCSRRVWRYRGAEAPEQIEATTYQRFRVNVWGLISCDKIEVIAKVDDKFNSQKYLRILQQVVPQIKNKHPNMIWMHDNVRFHRTNEIEQFFDQNHVQKMKWPAQSPDLNPIENVWALISQKLNLMIDDDGDASTPEELFKRVVLCASQISPETFENLYKSLPNRWRLVVEKNGGPTRY